MKGFLISLVPSIGALFLLWITLRAIFQADRRERAAMARLEAADRARSGVVGGGRPAPVSPDADAADDGSGRDGGRLSDGTGADSGADSGATDRGTDQRDG